MFIGTSVSWQALLASEFCISFKTSSYWTVRKEKNYFCLCSLSLQCLYVSYISQFFLKQGCLSCLHHREYLHCYVQFFYDISNKLIEYTCNLACVRICISPFTKVTFSEEHHLKWMVSWSSKTFCYQYLFGVNIFKEILFFISFLSIVTHKFLFFYKSCCFHL